MHRHWAARGWRQVRVRLVLACIFRPVSPATAHVRWGVNFRYHAHSVSSGKLNLHSPTGWIEIAVTTMTECVSSINQNRNVTHVRTDVNTRLCHSKANHISPHQFFQLRGGIALTPAVSTRGCDVRLRGQLDRHARRVSEVQVQRVQFRGSHPFDRTLQRFAHRSQYSMHCCGLGNK